MKNYQVKTEALVILQIMRKPNSTIVLLLIQNIHKILIHPHLSLNKIFTFSVQSILPIHVKAFSNDQKGCFNIFVQKCGNRRHNFAFARVVLPLWNFSINNGASESIWLTDVILVIWMWKFRIWLAIELLWQIHCLLLANQEEYFK